LLGAAADGEGASNLQEYLAGTNPTKPSSTFRLLNVAPTNADVRVSWTAVGGRNYIVQSAAAIDGSVTINFVDFSTVIPIVGTNETTTNYLHAGGATNRGGYYRVKLVP
jgi:hypothetical protein